MIKIVLELSCKDFAYINLEFHRRVYLLDQLHLLYHKYLRQKNLPNVSEEHSSRIKNSFAPR